MLKLKKEIFGVLDKENPKLSDFRRLAVQNISTSTQPILPKIRHATANGNLTVSLIPNSHYSSILSEIPVAVSKQRMRTAPSSRQRRTFNSSTVRT